MGMISIKSVTTFVVAAFALQFAAAGALAVDLLTQAKQQALPAKAYPELRQINDQVALMIARMDANTNQLKEYRKSRMRASDRRYSALTREFNQSRSRLSELERKLDKAPSLDVNRFPAPAGELGSSSSDVRKRAMTVENKKYNEVKALLRQCLKSLSDHYDQQLREIAKLR